VLRELGIGFVAYSPLGRGFLTGNIRSADQVAADSRAGNPRFSGENFEHNLRLVEQVEAIAAEVGATPAQVAIAWLLAQGDDIAPIPGTRRVARLEENVAADSVELTAEQVEKLTSLPAPAGDHHTEAQMRMPIAEPLPQGRFVWGSPPVSRRAGWRRGVLTPAAGVVVSGRGRQQMLLMLRRARVAPGTAGGPRSPP
jgi:hypothetical protein